MFLVKGRSYDANDLSQTILTETFELIDERVERVAQDLKRRLEKFIKTMTDMSEEPRQPSNHERNPAFSGLSVNIFYDNKLITRGRYTGRTISSARLTVYNRAFSINNAFNAMDTGIPERVANNRPMRFPRYEGNMIRRTGNLDTVQRVRVGENRRKLERDSQGRVRDNWVTVKEVKPSAPFHLLARVRLAIRQAERSAFGQNYGFIDLSKVKIRIQET